MTAQVLFILGFCLITIIMVLLEMTAEQKRK